MLGGENKHRPWIELRSTLQKVFLSYKALFVLFKNHLVQCTKHFVKFCSSISYSSKHSNSSVKMLLISVTKHMFVVTCIPVVYINVVYNCLVHIYMYNKSIFNIFLKGAMKSKNMCNRYTVYYKAMN